MGVGGGGGGGGGVYRSVKSVGVIKFMEKNVNLEKNV